MSKKCVDPKAIRVLLDYLEEDFQDWTAEEKRMDSAVIKAYRKVAKACR